MDVKPLKTESDYDSALAEISGLMDARPGTAAGDHLDVLVTLVSAHEEKCWRIGRRRGARPGPRSKGTGAHG